MNVLYELNHDKSTDLYLHYDENSYCSPHFHRAIEMLFVENGTFNTEIGGEKFLAEGGDIIFVHNYYTHSFTPQTLNHSFVIIIPYNLSDDFDSVFKNLTLPPKMGDKEFNATLIPIVKKLYDSKSNLPPLVKKGYLNVILGYLLSHYPLASVKSNPNIELIVSILEYIDKNYEKQITLSSLAQTFGYSKYYFSKLFNKYVNLNLNNYINLIRLQKLTTIAKSSSAKNISELAYSCGFDSLTTFYRVFKNTYGESPTAKLKTS